MSAYRLYSAASAGRFRLSLAHGVPDHEQYDLFEQQYLIRPIRPGLGNQLCFLRAARRWLRDHWQEFDIFHSLWSYQVSVSPAVQAARLGLPAITRVAAHHSDLADKRGWKTWLGVAARRRRSLEQLHAIVAISRAIYNELLTYGLPPQKIVMIPNGVDTQTFRPAGDDHERHTLRQQLRWTEEPTVLFAGGIEPRKQPHLLVEALAQLKQQRRTCQLILAGPVKDKAYASQMRQRAAAAGIARQIVWTGMSRNMPMLYRAADLFALPSRNEGMSNALLEAMASGLPALVTPISGSDELVQPDRTGQWIPSDPQVIAEALRIYLDQPALVRSHGQAARRLVEQRHSAPLILAAHERLFRRLLSEEK